MLELDGAERAGKRRNGARGSAFNENGGIAGGMYAGSRPQNSNNPKSVAQYDVACFQVSQH